ncbi:MAG: VCBS repeat-containing protein, partial [Bacteroidota bacterium]
YVNNGDGTFTNELKVRLPHTSKFSMGNNLSDINNDGKVDIYTLDMLPEDNRRQKLLMAPDNYNDFRQMLDKGFHHQYMRNMLHVANGDGTYSEIGQLSAISNTDWSWSALFADYDNDGWKDLYVTNGYRRDYTNLDFIDYMESFVQGSGQLKREDVMKLISEMPASNVRNYIYQNLEGRGFSDSNLPWGIHQPSNSNGAAYADLDNDGDLDLIVNNIDAPAFLYENTGSSAEGNHYLKVKLEGQGANAVGIGATVEIVSEGRRQSVIQNPYRGYLSAVSPTLHFGLAEATQVDTLMVRWSSGSVELRMGVPADQVIILKESDALEEPVGKEAVSPVLREVDPALAFRDPSSSFLDYNRQPLLINQLSHTGPTLTRGDVNQDGRNDLLLGGAKGQSAQLYLGSETGLELLEVRSMSIDRASHDTDVLILDANGDGLNDIYVASGGYHDFEVDDDLLQDRLYINDGLGSFYKNTRALPQLKINTTVVVANDYDEDGDLDLFVGGGVVPGRFPEHSGGYVLENDGRGRYKVALEISDNLGHVKDAIWGDLQGDGTSELIVAGEWMPISVWSWIEGSFTNETPRLFEERRSGWWNALALRDFNGDGMLDIVAGNNGLNCQIKVNLKEPAELYYADFDENGSVDPILCYFVQGERYPYATRKELLKQLAPLQSKFTSYESYAEAKIEDVFDRGELRSAERLVATNFETTIYLSQSDGTFRLGTLPIEAQYAPVEAIAVDDFDRDGELDLILAGNNSYSSLRLGKFSANYGQLLRGDGKGGFEYVPQYESGLRITGDVREILRWGEGQLLFGITGASLIAYEW